MKITQLNRYPLKSGAVERCQNIDVEDRGPSGDRTWMVVEPDGTFVTARKHPKLVLVGATHTGMGRCLLQRPDADAVEAYADGKYILDVTVWNEPCSAWVAQSNVNDWMSQYLGIDCRLVYMPPSSSGPSVSRRALNAPKSALLMHSLLLISEASLADLNGRMERPVSMDRFRPNVVVDGTQPFEEDSWKRIRIGVAEFTCFSPCARCVLTTVDRYRRGR